jgi:hypothetical protein
MNHPQASSWAPGAGGLRNEPYNHGAPPPQAQVQTQAYAQSMQLDITSVNPATNKILSGNSYYKDLRGKQHPRMFPFLSTLHDDVVSLVLSYVVEAPFEVVNPALCKLSASGGMDFDCFDGCLFSEIANR